MATCCLYALIHLGCNYIASLQVKQHILGHALDDLSEPTPVTDTSTLTRAAAVAGATSCPDWLSDASSSSSAASQQQQHAPQRRRSSSTQQQHFAPACSDDLEWGGNDDVDSDVTTNATSATAAASKAGAPLVEGSMREQGPNWAQDSFSRLGQQVLLQ
jgi:hypothetical protein